MSVKKNKLLRKAVKENVSGQLTQFVFALLDCPFWERARWAITILFRAGYKDLKKGFRTGGGDGTGQATDG